MEVLFVAAENGALAGGKVGGVGDVVRDLPPALAKHGCRVTVMTPSHGFLHLHGGCRRVGDCRFFFRGGLHSAEIFECTPAGAAPGVRQLVLQHPALGIPQRTPGRHLLYADDPPERPFFTDGSRFALFCAAVAAAVDAGTVGPVDVIHLHDWHTALVLLLARSYPDSSAIRTARSVFSIHNLAFQGIRPLAGSDSSLDAWFPGMRRDPDLVADPRWRDCLNPMAVGIRLADRVHTVSPTYAREIRQPDLKPGFHGGEGLHRDLDRVYREGRLVGILNGCDYPPRRAPECLPFDALLRLVGRETVRWSAEAGAVPAAHFVALARTLEMGARPEGPDLMLSSVGRLGEQKFLLLRHPGSRGTSALDDILEGIGPRGCYFLLGSGDPAYEAFLTAAAGRHDNFIFVNGFSETCARALYASGDLFLMPSSFEPCGLSQMLAMRDGQPCIVHAVGGLNDTVEDGGNGFSFSGGTLAEQVDRFVGTTLKAVALKRERPAAWNRLRENAAAARFGWEDSAQRYVRELYSADGRSGVVPTASSGNENRQVM